MSYLKKPHSDGQEGFMLMAKASNEMKTLKVIVGVKKATASLSVEASDASVSKITQQLVGGDEEKTYVVEIPYQLSANNKNILVKYVLDQKDAQEDGYITLKGAYLTDGGKKIPETPEGITVEPKDKAISVSGSEQNYDRYRIYYGENKADLDNLIEVETLPATINNLENFNRYYLAVSGIRDGAESANSEIFAAVPETGELNDRQRAYIDFKATYSDILNRNESFDKVTKDLNFNLKGKVYESTFTFTTTMNNHKYGVMDNGKVNIPILPQGDAVGKVIIGVAYRDNNIMIEEPTRVIASDINDLPYVKGSKTITEGEVDLTSQGSKDWVQFNDSSLASYAKKDSKASIKNIKTINGTSGKADDAKFTFVATDAKDSQPVNNRGVVAKGLNNGFTFELPYSNKLQNAKVYADAWGGDVTLEVRVNDSVMYRETFGKDSSSGLIGQCFDFDYKVPNKDDKVEVKLYCSKDLKEWGGCSTVIQAITLKEKDGTIPLPDVNEVIDQELNAYTKVMTNTIDLTKQGTRDWVLFNTDNLVNLERMADSNVIKDVKVLGNISRVDKNTGANYIYSNGTNKVADELKSNVVLEGKDNGISFTIPSSSNTNQLKVNIGAWSAKAVLEATVEKDGQEIKKVSRTFNTGKQSSGTAAKYTTFVLDYLLNEGEELKVKVYSQEVHDQQWGNINIGGITLSEQYNIDIDKVQNGTITLGANRALAGQEVNVFTEAKAGYILKAGSLKYVTKDDQETIIEDNVFVMPDKDITVKADFIANDMPAINTKALEIAVSVANNVSEEELANVVPAVVNEFKEALGEAKSILANNTATQDTIDASFARLSKAMQMLDFIKGDKKELQLFVNEVAKLNENDYISVTWKPYASMLKKAKAVLTDKNAMQEEVNETYDKLVRAFLDLRLIPNKDWLNELINQVEGLDKALYTVNTWKAVEIALTNAKIVFENKNATKAEVVSATQTIKKAIDELVKTNLLIDPDTTEKVNPGDKKPGKENAIKTGDTVRMTGVLGLIASLGTIAYFIKKRED